ncbi:MAG: LAGLIDADG family homing endonuclease [Candidatus Omnitrophica bacterium]|nr:LAGLIDADG family homing endonuclease [Candidatus Omnitrophota bacterium]MBU4472914.1 LAGLIDADG family homing endonuclease [Candidatus Omnitrophota bacterium]MCG2706162.1 LAGLIDADG family homing endonuclease [Candidatus Omnitrophota bacterium]
MLTSWYVTGFCDGEAAFTYSRDGGSFAVYFSIKQREDNRQIIDEIQEYFGYIGNIYRVKEALPTKNSGFTKPSVYYRVNRIDDLKIVIDHFDKYPLQSKKKLEAYKVWREMVMYKSENYRDIDYNELRPLAERLSSLNMQSRAFKVHRR